MFGNSDLTVLTTTFRGWQSPGPCAGPFEPYGCHTHNYGSNGPAQGPGLCQPRNVVVRSLFPNTVSSTLVHAVNLTICVNGLLVCSGNDQNDYALQDGRESGSQLRFICFTKKTKRTDNRHEKMTQTIVMMWTGPWELCEIGY